MKKEREIVRPEGGQLSKTIWDYAKAAANELHCDIESHYSEEKIIESIAINDVEIVFRTIVTLLETAWSEAMINQHVSAAKMNEKEEILRRLQNDYYALIQPQHTETHFKPFHEYFEAHAESNPSHLAMIYQDDESQWTYGILNERANQLAHHLMSLKKIF